MLGDMSQGRFHVLLFGMLLACAHANVSSAQGTSLDLSICNDGDVELSVAAARNVNTAFTYGLEAEGWWTVAPGECTMVMPRFDADYAYLAFAYTDSSGTFGYLDDVNPANRSEPQSSPRTFQRSFVRLCVGLAPFTYTGSLEELGFCPSSDEYHLTPFPLHFEPQYDTRLPEHVSYKFWLKADPDVPVRPFPLKP